MHVIPSVKKVIKYCKFAGLFLMSASSTANLPARPVRDVLKRKLVKITENTQTRKLKKKNLCILNICKKFCI